MFVNVNIGSLKKMNEHYKQHTIEAIDVIHDWDLGFELGNVVKYIARHKYKGSELRDLEKAVWYLETYIKRQQMDLYQNTITGTTHLG